VGLVSSLVGRGTFVAATRPNYAEGLPLLGAYSTDELHEVRSHLEIPGAGLAALRRGADEIERLREILDSHEGCTEPVEWVKLDVAFHRELAAATGNSLQLLLVESLREVLVEQSLAVAGIEGRLATATDEHRAIMDAVVAADEQAARAAMAYHLDRIRFASYRMNA
jgi:DNA-binding FadR family transcriptional regulator